MAPLTVLLGVFVAALLFTKLMKSDYQFFFSGRVALAVMLIFTAIGHFVFTRGMTLMLPDIIPFKTVLIIGTGIAEIAAAFGLMVPAYRKLTGWVLIVFFIMLLPANIYAALHHVNYQSGTLDGHGTAYLWFRVPLQIVFIGWTWLVAVRNGVKT